MFSRRLTLNHASAQVGLTEHMQESLTLAERAFGLAPGSGELQQSDMRLINPHRPAVDARDRMRISQHTAVRLETALYEHARKRFFTLSTQHGLLVPRLGSNLTRLRLEAEALRIKKL